MFGNVFFLVMEAGGKGTMQMEKGVMNTELRHYTFDFIFLKGGWRRRVWKRQ